MEKPYRVERAFGQRNKWTVYGPGLTIIKTFPFTDAGREKALDLARYMNIAYYDGQRTLKINLSNLLNPE